MAQYCHLEVLAYQGALYDLEDDALRRLVLALQGNGGLIMCLSISRLVDGDLLNQAI